MRKVLIALILTAACSPARIARQIVTQSNSLHQPPVDPVHEIQSSAHGGIGSAQPGDGNNAPVPADGSKLLPQDTATTATSKIPGSCSIPGKDGAASPNCMARYDGVRFSPRKKGPAVNTQNR